MCNMCYRLTITCKMTPPRRIRRERREVVEDIEQYIVYIYICTHTIHTYIYIYIYIDGEVVEDIEHPETGFIAMIKQKDAERPDTNASV